MKHITTSLITFCSLAALLLPGCKKECTSGQNFVVRSPMRVEPQANEIRLGDTLTVTIEVPYNNFDLEKNVPVNVAGYKVSEFGIDFALFNEVNNRIFIEGPEQFNITFLRGGGARLQGTSSFQNRFAVEVERYLFVMKVVPLKKGLVDLVNYRAEARDGCTLVDFSPTCINNPNNYDIYYQWGTGIVGPSEYFNNQRHYYIWVR
jgi:hypothetical protein